MTNETDDMIKVEGVSKQFAQNHKKKLPVLEDINFTVNRGEFLCIVGPSGCGKTVLLDILGGFIKPTSGRVFIDESEVTGPQPKYVSIFQDYKLLPWRTVRKNIELGFEAKRGKKISRAEIDSIVDAQIKSVGLEGFEDYKPGEISGGMKQRVAIARAMAVEPEILFMDEPFGALDSVTKEAMQAKMMQLLSKKNRPTVVLVTHDVDEAVYMADRILVMQPAPGRISTIVDVDLGKPVIKYTRAFNALRDKVIKELKV